MIDYKEVAILAIKNYLNINDEYWNINNLTEKYALPISIIQENYEKYKSATGGLVGVNSMTQGSQSISFNSSISNVLITEEVKMLLPKPRKFYAW